MKKQLARVMAMLRGLLIVAKYGFRKPITIRYPEERRKLPIVSRGRHFLTKWP
ncbi:MAG: NADH-quinone oxidoreductase subunit NuoI, partial [Verrucomicrobia bacterium]|nr:NADH-quinone oxidoreductase subunit NuoI [Verrucomicrobiota bacterium]